MRGPVVWSDGVEDSNAIDPGVMRDPTNGTLWLTYGSYFGYIRLVELDPKTGKRLHPEAKPVNIAINSEASIMIFHDGWYYLLVTHGSCCAGANSSYNIRMGRSRKVTGPFLDNMGIDMLQGGGKLFAGSSGRHIGPGHFGLLDLGDGVQKFSCHYEADLDRGGISVLDIRPLLWRDGWPVAGDNSTAGTYQIESARTGTALEMAVQGVPVGGAARARRERAAAAHRRHAATRRHRRRFRPRTPRRSAQLAGRPGRCSHGALHAAGAAEMDDHAGRQCRRLSRVALFQDHHCRHGARACRDRGRRTRRRSRLHRRPRTTLAHRSADRWHVSADAEDHAGRERSRWRFRRSAAACRRSQNSSQTAIGSAGCSRRRDQPLACVLTALASRSAFLGGACHTPRGQQPAAARARSGADADASVNARQTRRTPRFLQRWLVLEPITVPGQLTEVRCRRPSKRSTSRASSRVVPRDGDRVHRRRRTSSSWHAVDTTNYNVNLYHFAYALNKPTSNVLFWAVTTSMSRTRCADVRLAIGSNAASVWWLNGEEVIGIYGDRQTVIDDGVSKRLTLTQGTEHDSRGRLSTPAAPRISARAFSTRTTLRSREFRCDWRQRDPCDRR